MKIRNSNGDVDPTSPDINIIRTTTALRAKSLKQKFFEVAPADYFHRRRRRRRLDAGDPDEPGIYHLRQL